MLTPTWMLLGYTISGLQQTFFQPPHQGGCRGRGGRRGHGRGGSTGGNKQQQPPQCHSIPSATFTKPWIRTDNAFRRSLTLCFPCSPSRGGEDSECAPCVQSSLEGEKTLCVQPPPVGGNHSVCTIPTRGGENSVCTVTGYIQTSSVQRCIYSRKSEKPASGGKTEAVPSRVGKTRVPLIIGLIRDGYKLPFRERFHLSRVPCIVSSYAGFNKQNALWTSIQDLLQKGAVKVVHTPDSLGFYSRLFLVPKPGNRWRPVVDLSSLNKFHTHLTQERGMGHIY